MKTQVRYLLSSPLLSLALLFGTLFATANSQALDPWSDPQIVRAVFALNLADDQKPLFASAVEDCLQGYMSDVKKLMRRIIKQIWIASLRKSANLALRP